MQKTEHGFRGGRRSANRIRGDKWQGRESRGRPQRPVRSVP